jgi:endonuclease/exonuclease/phosphatase family metal-dependent hydrolase
MPTLRNTRLIAFCSLGSALVLLSLGACGGEGKRPESAGPNGEGEQGAAKNAGEVSAPAVPERPAKRDIRVATYNAGLAVGVLKYADERAAMVAQTLAKEDVDLLCVQEFWLEDHWRMLAQATAKKLPNTHRLPPEKKGGLCDEAEVAPLASCATASCGHAAQHEIATCLLGSCGGEITKISAECFRCLAANPRGKPEEIVRACVAPPQKEKLPAAGARGGPEAFRVYAGSTGTGILTNAEILERDALTLPSVLDRRAVLYAKLATPIGELHAFCTHLTANLAGVPHPGKASWRRDQSAQIDALLAFVEKKAAGRPALILGDLNTGPAIAPAISPSLPDHYARLVQSGFLNPYAAQRDVQCTYCFDNPLEGGRGTRGVLIDHVLLRNFEGQVLTGAQIMRPLVTVQPAGKPVRIGLSDHYGVSVTLSSGS